jgi:hypothetical protein
VGRRKLFYAALAAIMEANGWHTKQHGNKCGYEHPDGE